MIKKKICLLGSFSVGKSSLIRQYVFNIYSERYLSSVGVKVDKKELTLETGEEVTLLIWDLEGKNDYRSVASTYLLGVSGYFLVADGTRRDTLDSVRGTRDFMAGLVPSVPSLLLLNKADLSSSWALETGDYADFRTRGIPVARTSAKDGTGVDLSFLELATRMVRDAGA